MRKIILLSMLAMLLSITSVFALTNTSAEQIAQTAMPDNLTGMIPVYVPTVNGIFIWGGYNSTGTAQANQNMFVFNTSTGLWTNRGRTGAPDARYDYGAAYKALGGGAIYYFGGINATSQMLVDTIVIYNISTSSWVPYGFNVSAGIGCVRSCATRANHTLVSNGNTLFAFGGRTADGAGASTVVNQTLELNVSMVGADAYANASWIPLGNDFAGGANGIIVARECSAAAYDSTQNLIYQYGGVQTGGAALTAGKNDLFILNLSATGFNWANASAATASITPMLNATMVYDTADTALYLIGGATAVPAFTSNVYRIASTADPKSAVFSAQSWHYAGADMGAVYASDMDGILIFGGFVPNAARVGNNVSAIGEDPTVTITTPTSYLASNAEAYKGTLPITGSVTTAGRTLATVWYAISPGTTFDLSNRYATGNAALTIAVGTSSLSATETLNGAYYPNGYYTLRTIATDILGFATITDTVFQVINLAPQVPPTGPSTGGTTGKVETGEEGPGTEQPSTETETGTGVTSTGSEAGKEGAKAGAGTTTGTGASSTMWLWAVIGALVVVAGAAYFFLMKK